MSIQTKMTDDGVVTTIAEGGVERFAALVDRFAGSIQIPEPAAFTGADGSPSAFLVRPDLTALGQRLIEQDEAFAHLVSLEVLFLWKAQGGSTSGKDTLGKAQKPSGLLRHFSEADFVVWLAADHLRERLMSPKQIEAVLFHELSHCGFDDEKGKPCIIGHDLTAFVSEIERYGLWHDEWRRADRAMRQLRLPGAGA